MPILDTKVLTETEDSDLWEFEEELGSTARSNKHPVHCDEKVTQLWHLIHPNSITRDRFHFFRHGNQETSLFTSSNILQPELSAYQKNIPRGHHGQRTYTPPIPNSRRIGPSSKTVLGHPHRNGELKARDQCAPQLGRRNLAGVHRGVPWQQAHREASDDATHKHHAHVDSLKVRSQKLMVTLGIWNPLDDVSWDSNFGVWARGSTLGFKLWNFEQQIGFLSGIFRKHLVWPSWKVATNVAT